MKNAECTFKSKYSLSYIYADICLKLNFLRIKPDIHIDEHFLKSFYNNAKTIVIIRNFTHLY